MNKVAEKAVWSGLTPSEKIQPNPVIEDQLTDPTQLCYKCNAIIPDDSDFCPSCGIKLYVPCPKCQLIYSSQYAFCKKCGTNREEYINEQERLEKEKREAERLAQEKQELEREKQAQQRKAEAERIQAENDEIMKTDEYKEVHKFLVKTRKNYRIVFVLLCIISFPIMIFLEVTYLNNVSWVMAWLLIYMFLMFGIVASFDNIFRNVLIKRSKRCKYPKMCAYIAADYSTNPRELKRLMIKAYKRYCLCGQGLEV